MYVCMYVQVDSWQEIGISTDLGCQQVKKLTFQEWKKIINNSINNELLSFNNNFHQTCKIHEYGFLSYVFETLKYYMIDILEI